MKVGDLSSAQVAALMCEQSREEDPTLAEEQLLDRLQEGQHYCEFTREDIEEVLYDLRPVIKAVIHLS